MRLVDSWLGRAFGAAKAGAPGKAYQGESPQQAGAQGVKNHLKHPGPDRPYLLLDVPMGKSAQRQWESAGRHSEVLTWELLKPGRS